MTASLIHDSLYQGSIPPMGNYLKERGFDVLVLCAKEFQPSSTRYPGVVVLHCPLEDDEPTTQELQLANRAADMVSVALKQGKKVLVTCYMGWNRSGLVTGMALCKTYGWKGLDAVSQIKARRENALSNKHFVRVLSKL